MAISTINDATTLGKDNKVSGFNTIFGKCTLQIKNPIEYGMWKAKCVLQGWTVAQVRKYGCEIMNN